LGVAPDPREWLDQPSVFSGGLLGTVIAVGPHDDGGLPERLRLLADKTATPTHRDRLEDAGDLAASGMWLAVVG
jgi:hypothetical protein